LKNTALWSLLKIPIRIVVFISALLNPHLTPDGPLQFLHSRYRITRVGEVLLARRGVTLRRKKTVSKLLLVEAC
jgi:hypothetical protein